MTDEKIHETGQLVLDGMRTMRTSDDTYAKLLEMTALHPALEIDCRAVDEADLSFVQLLLAARLSARLEGRSVRLTHPAAGPLLDVLQRGGFLSGSTTADHAFWNRSEIVS